MAAESDKIQELPTRRAARTILNSNEGDGLSRLFAAAVVSRQFRQMLLKRPETALKHGYLGENFTLSREEREKIISARGQSLADFAKKIIGE